LKLVHELKNLDTSGCDNNLVKLTIRGAENLGIYSEKAVRKRNVITLPILKLIGHEIAAQNWNSLNKQIVWTACCLAFFGSLRMGEILFNCEKSFDPHASFLWGDVNWQPDHVVLRIKSPKSKNKGGDWVDIFEFKDSVCPVKALKKLSEMSKNRSKDSPVFTFENGKLLTKKVFNETIGSLLKRFEKTGAKFSGHSFRAGIPATLARFPELVNNNHIQGWGRWGSNAYLVYTRLKTDQKRKIYEKIVQCLNSK